MDTKKYINKNIEEYMVRTFDSIDRLLSNPNLSKYPEIWDVLLKIPKNTKYATPETIDQFNYILNYDLSLYPGTFNVFSEILDKAIGSKRSAIFHFMNLLYNRPHISNPGNIFNIVLKILEKQKGPTYLIFDQLSKYMADESKLNQILENPDDFLDKF